MFVSSCHIDPESVPTGTTAEEAASSPAVASTAEPDVWDNVQDATPTNAETKSAEGEAAAATPAESADKKDEEDEDANKLTLEEYQAIQAKKKEELAAKFGGVTAAQPRALSEEEVWNLCFPFFTRVDPCFVQVYTC
jgi:hypothetical protein